MKCPKCGKWSLMKFYICKNCGYKIDIKFEELVKRLTSENDDVFVSGMRDACSYTHSNKFYGVDAMEEAIKRKAKSENIDFYEPGLTYRSGKQYAEARSELLNLARKKSFLADARLTQELISIWLAMYTHLDFNDLAEEIIEVSKGLEEIHNFQLLYNQMHDTAVLKNNDIQRK